PAAPSIEEIIPEPGGFSVRLAWISDGGANPESFLCRVYSIQGSDPIAEGTVSGLTQGQGVVGISGLVDGLSYVVACIARRTSSSPYSYVIESPASSPSSPVTAGTQTTVTTTLATPSPAASAPAAPTVSSAVVSGDRTVTITVQINSDGGSPVTSYQCQSVEDAALVGISSTPEVAVAGLTTGLEYSFSCRVSNAVGHSAQSGAPSRKVKVCPSCQNNATCARGAPGPGSVWGCDCPEGFTGPLCAQRSCPGNCSNAGDCNHKTGQCSCWSGVSGASCSELEPLQAPL
ncbi:unnamed protein product, partial [Polarella glacialis]